MISVPIFFHHQNLEEFVAGCDFPLLDDFHADHVLRRENHNVQQFGGRLTPKSSIRQTLKKREKTFDMDIISPSKIRKIERAIPYFS